MHGCQTIALDTECCVLTASARQKPGIQLLNFAVSHWQHKEYLFGYIRNSHQGWATHQGFAAMENLQADDNHRFMGKYI